MLGDICYRAFKAIADAHNFTPDFPSPEAATGMAAALIGRDGCFDLVAELDGRIVGSNFLDERNPISGVGPITAFDSTRLRTHIAAEVKNFDADTLIGRKEARRMDRYAQFASVAADEAIADANFPTDPAVRQETGVIVATGIRVGQYFDEAPHARTDILGR